MKKPFDRKIELVCLIFIISIGIFLRFFQLSSVPPGLYQDETALGYNAYSILQTGKDEHGEIFPIYFESFGDFKLPVYIYLTVVSVALFGLTEFAIRFPSALFGSLTLLSAFFLIRQITVNTRLTLLLSALLAINPWHLFFSRAGFEVNVGLFFAVTGTWFLIKAIHQRVHYVLYTLAFLCFFLAAYSYNVSRILAPMLLLVFSILYTKSKTNKQKALFIIIPLLLLSSIMLLSLTVSSGGTTTNIIGGGDSLVNAIELRSYMIQMPDIVEKLFFSSPAQYIKQYIENIIGFLSPAFLFVSGSSHGNHGIATTGQFYLFEFFTVILGIFIGIRTKEKLAQFAGLWLLTTLAVIGVSNQAPHATRGFFLVLPLTCFSTLGLFSIFQYLHSRLSQRFIWIIPVFLVGIFVTMQVVQYFSSYYYRFPAVYAKQWRSQDKAVNLYLQGIEKEYDRIIIDQNANLIYTSLLFYQKYSPSQLHATQIRELKNKEGYYGVDKIGTYEFREITPEDTNLLNTLFVTDPDKEFPELIKIKEFAYPPRSVVLIHQGNLAQYPITDAAYTIYRTKEQ